jgi:cell division protein FtsI/penicillin-binding protein 2
MIIIITIVIITGEMMYTASTKASSRKKIYNNSRDCRRVTQNFERRRTIESQLARPASSDSASGRC